MTLNVSPDVERTGLMLPNIVADSDGKAQSDSHLCESP
jgi:hypothetical protein